MPGKFFHSRRVVWSWCFCRSGWSSFKFKFAGEVGSSAVSRTNDPRSSRAAFTSVKKELVWSVTEATTTPTPLSHDEYELPREIRTVRINRLRARRVMSEVDVADKRKYSVFAQLQNETKSWGGAAFRRSFVAKGHGGQKRAFKVKLIGEGVNDYSGPYREVFTDAMAEVLKCDNRGNGSLGVLDPTPNNVAGVGENRDLYMFSLNGNDIRKIRRAQGPGAPSEMDIQLSFSSLIAPRDESSREAEEAVWKVSRDSISTWHTIGSPASHEISLASHCRGRVRRRQLEGVGCAGISSGARSLRRPSLVAT